MSSTSANDGPLEATLETEATIRKAMRRPLIILGMLTLLILIGMFGFRWIGGSPWMDSLYLAVVTLTTLGSRDPASNEATMAFTVLYLACGLGLFSYSLFSLGQSLLDEQVRIYWSYRKMLTRVRAMQGHHIICGQGRMGLTICKHLAERSQPFVVIDCNSEKLESTCRAQDWPFLVGDATDDELLLNAGIKQAKSLASVLPSDADNVYVVLSARMLNADLQIVSRASNDKAIEKIERAGATRVISPFSSGGVNMARLMINPSLESFMEVAQTGENDLELIEFEVADSSAYCGKKLSETSLGDRGVMILGIIRKSGERLLPPPSSTVISSGDKMFAFGRASVVYELIGL